MPKPTEVESLKKIIRTLRAANKALKDRGELLQSVCNEDAAKYDKVCAEYASQNKELRQTQYDLQNAQTTLLMRTNEREKSRDIAREQYNQRLGVLQAIKEFAHCDD